MFRSYDTYRLDIFGNENTHRTPSEKSRRSTVGKNETKKSSVKTLSSRTPVNVNYVSFGEMMNQRREEASRSILVEIEGIKESGGLKHFLERIGPVNNYFLYRNSGKNFVLAEFKNIATKDKVVKNAYHSKDPLSIPVTSPYLYFYNSEKKFTNSSPDCTEHVECDENKILLELADLKCSDNDRLRTEMNHLKNKLEISDLSTRLRFLTCHQLDDALAGLFSGVRALPFGSSVTGFGRNSGDLDIYLQFNRNIDLKKNNNSLLYFHHKTRMRDTNVLLKLIGDLISVMLPGCAKVISILTARVPIIKYQQRYTNLECDLNISCPAGVDFTHMLWIMKHWDKRVAPLAYTLMTWFSHNKICPTKPGPHITNFSMMFLIVFFLQNQNILPSLHLFQSLPDTTITQSIDPDADLFFPDLRKVQTDMLPEQKINDLDVDSLLLKFFEFYSNFNFETTRIAIYRGVAMPKKSRSPLEIENPANPDLNVSKNVTKEGLLVFKKAVNEALATLGKKDYKSISLLDLLPQSSRSDSRSKDKKK